MNSVVSFAKKNKFYITIFILSSLSFVYMLCMSGVKSLWYDDIYQIYFTWEKSYAEAMKHVLTVDLNPPLWPTFTYFWQKIAPFGTVWLKLPSMLGVFVGTILTGLCAKRIFGEKTAILAVILTALHSGVVLNCGYSYRAYGFLFLFSALLIFTYVKRYFAPTVLNRVLFFVAIFLIGFTHYFGALLCVLLAICDLVLCFLGKQKKNFIIEYLIVGICELPWVLAQLANIQETFNDFWPAKPSLKSFIAIFYTLSLESYLLFAIFGLLGILTVVEVFMAIKKKKLFDDTEHFIFRLLFISVTVMFIFFIFCYSLLSSASLWVTRYFLFLVPLAIIFISATFVKVMEKIIKRFAKTDKSAVISTACTFVLITAILIPQFIIKIYKNVHTPLDPFDQAAEIVMSQSEINGDSQVLVFNTTNCAGGWHYYLGRKNTRSLDNVTLVGLKEYSTELAVDYHTVIIYADHFNGSFDLDTIIEELNETHTVETVDADMGIYKFTKE